MHLHNPVLAYEIGDDFLKFSYQAEQGKLDPFVLVVEGSIPNEKIKKEGYWAAMGTDPDRPADQDHGMDRSPGAQGIGGRGRWHLRHLRRNSCHGGAIQRAVWGLRIIWVGLAVQGRLADRECAGLPGAAGQFHGNLLYLLYQVAGLAPMIPLDEQLRPTWLFGKTVHEGCDRARLLRAR